MSSVDGVPSAGTPGERGSTQGSGSSTPARRTGQVPPPRALPGPAGVGPDSSSQALATIDPVTAVLELAQGASSPPVAGLQAQLLDWVAPRTRQFEAMQPGRLVSLLGMAVDQLAQAAPELDELGWLGAAALERELRDHHALADRRATMIDP